MLLGVAYYPEHWPQERWELDARLMAEAGITRIRMAEFAWHRMEPEPGRFDFAWLEEVISLFGSQGILTILGTPTPTYPRGCTRCIPTSTRSRATGRSRSSASGRMRARTIRAIRAYARRIVEHMTASLGSNPYVVAWQTDNEFGCHEHRALLLRLLPPGIPGLAVCAVPGRHRRA